MNPMEFQSVLSNAIHSALESGKLVKDFATLPPLASHAHNSPRELENFFLEKFCHRLTKEIANYFSGHRKLFLLPLLPKEEGQPFRAVVYWRKTPPVVVGNLFLSLFLEENQLFLEIIMDINSCPQEILRIPFGHHIKTLHAPKNEKKLPVLQESKALLVFIDLEWVSCYKSAQENNQVALGQISEFSFWVGDFFYTSGHLLVSPQYLNRMHRKLLIKMGISPELMQERHSKGQNFLTVWQEVLVPILENTDKQVVFLSFGTEDGKILRKLFPGKSGKKVQMVDVSTHFSIFNFGQMALLNGLGVSFTHDFSSAMDVRALSLIYQVFSHGETIEDSRNLQLSLQLHKMYLHSQNQEDKDKLSLYLSLLLQEEKTKLLFQNAVHLAKTMVEQGHFGKDTVKFNENSLHH